MPRKPTKLQHDYAGTTSPWFMLDNEEFFNQNRENLVQMGFKETDIEYRFNSDGFRMDMEMSDVPEGSDIYFGDSTTMGYGANLEDTWAYKHNEMRGGPFVNLANAAGSIETIYRLADYWIPIIKPKSVYVLEPPFRRVEFIDHFEDAWVSGVWTYNKERTDVEKMHEDIASNNPEHQRDLARQNFENYLFETYISSDTNNQVVRKRARQAMNYVCAENNVSLNWLDPLPFTEEYYFKARDLIHSNDEQHDKILDRFIGVVTPTPLPTFR